MRAEPYLPLDAYGLLGDCRGSALVARDGSIDWMCVPRFDSPPVCARLLDAERGGSWRLGPAEPAESELRYAARTAVLETEHRSAGGVLLVRDTFVPPGGGEAPGVLLRTCECLSGDVDLESRVDLRADWGRRPAEGLRLESTDGDRVVLRQGERAAFVFGWGDELPRPSEADALVEETAAWWRAWSDSVVYDGPYAEAVVRSAITLKLLTDRAGGAIVAAPTSSLPEVPGGEANWDYRYTWLRDASLTLYALLAVGLRGEGDPFFDWICARVGDAQREGSDLRVMYDMDGGSDHAETTLGHLDGYAGSRPVREGNAACEQTQLDVYGEVLDCFSTASVWGRSDKLALWEDYRPLADWVCDRWQEPDNGIWELRGGERHYVHSKVMAWVALDRAVRTATAQGLDGDLARWRANAAAVHAAVLEHGWSDELGGFRQAFDVERLDAANLVMPLVGFLPADDARVRSNLERTRSELADGALLRRFVAEPDEVVAGEATFTLCSFWAVNALAAQGRTEEAAEAFEAILARATPLGLYAEQLDPATGEHRGNFPQAFVHAALLSAAVNLARAGAIGEAPASEHAPGGTAHLVARAR